MKGCSFEAVKGYQPADDQKPCTVCQKVVFWVEKKPCICAECKRVEVLEAALWEVARLTNEPGDADALLRRIDRTIRAVLSPSLSADIHKERP